MMQLRIRYITLIGLLVLALVACNPQAQPTTIVIETEETVEPTETKEPDATPTFTSPQPTPAPLEAPDSPLSTPPANPAATAALGHLITEYGLSPQDVNILSIEEMQWSDGSLGCPQPGMVYIQVIIPGYRILMEANGEMYDVHTDQTGDSIVVCDFPVKEFGGAGVAFKTLLTELTETYPGFGLGQQRDWTSQDITTDARVGSSTWAWRSGEWTLEMVFAAVEEPGYDARLFHQKAGTVWSGTLEPNGRITSLEEPVSLSFSAGECDQSITPDSNPEWATVTISVEGSDVLVEQNLSYVCCAELVISAGRNGDVIKLVETNAGEVCRCMCGYPVTARLTDLPAGDYTVEVWGVQYLDAHSLELLGSSEVTIP
jgi:hypothetical protein